MFPRQSRSLRRCLAAAAAAVSAAGVLAAGGCGGGEESHDAHPAGHTSTPAAPAPSVAATPVVNSLPGMPAVTDPGNVYAGAGPNMLSPAVRADRPLVYVPHNDSGDVWVIDPKTYQVVGRYPVGKEIQHVVPSWDMRTLYATDDLPYGRWPEGHLLAFDAKTGQPTKSISVVDPYNMYFTPDGKYAISVAEDHKALFWYDPHTFVQKDVTQVPECAGVDHADFSVDGRTAVFTCEFAGAVAVVDVASHKLLRMIHMPKMDMHMGPQDIKLAPDGSRWYVADCDANGVWVLDQGATKVATFLPTGRCAHGLYLDRSARRMFVTNRLAGSISVLDARTGATQTVWHLPGGGSPDMGNLTADGNQLWLSGRYDNVVYVLDANSGQLLHKIPVGGGPHGLCVWPQPGRYSLGHTGITR